MASGYNLLNMPGIESILAGYNPYQGGYNPYQGGRPGRTAPQNQDPVITPMNQQQNPGPYMNQAMQLVGVNPFVEDQASSQPYWTHQMPDWRQQIS